MTDAANRPDPKRLADFEIVRRLGAGGMAEVFLAKKRGAEGTFKLLVLKRILPAYGASRRFRTMFAEEAQLATRLNHPNIVQVYDFQDYGDEGQLLSMEYVEGPDLKEVLRSAKSQDTRLPPHVSAYIAAEVARGLHYAHERKDEGGAPLRPRGVLPSEDPEEAAAEQGDDRQRIPGMLDERLLAEQHAVDLPEHDPAIDALAWIERVLDERRQRLAVVGQHRDPRRSPLQRQVDPTPVDRVVADLRTPGRIGAEEVDQQVDHGRLERAAGLGQAVAA